MNDDIDGIDDLLAKCEEQDRERDWNTVGELLSTLAGTPNLADRIKVAEIGKTLLYTALYDAAPEVHEEARGMWGELVDVALQECGYVREPHPPYRLVLG